MVVHRLDDAGERRMRARQLGVQAPALGHVGDDPGHLDRAVLEPARRRAVMDPAGDAVEPPQAVLDVGVLRADQRRVEGGDRVDVLRMDRGGPVLHRPVGVGPAEQAIGARPLVELLDPPVGVGDGAVDVLADHVEQMHEAIVGLGQARGGLLVLGDVGDETLDEQTTAFDRLRAGAVPDRALDAVEADQPVGHLGGTAGDQLGPEAVVGRAIQRVDARIPQLPGLVLAVGVGADEALQRGPGEARDVAPVNRQLAHVYVVVEEFEDSLEMVPAPAKPVQRVGKRPVHDVFSSGLSARRGPPFAREAGASQRIRSGTPCGPSRSATGRRTGLRWSACRRTRRAS
jgi:hypothetical protein